MPTSALATSNSGAALKSKEDDIVGLSAGNVYSCSLRLVQKFALQDQKPPAPNGFVSAWFPQSSRQKLSRSGRYTLVNLLTLLS